MLTALLSTALVVAPPALEQTVDAGALAWLQVPALATSVKAIEGSAFAPLLSLALPAPSRAAIARAASSSLVAALYRGEAPGATAVAMWIEAGEAAPELAAQLKAFYAGLGLTAAAGEAVEGLTLERLSGAGEEMTLFVGAGRCGVSADPGRAARALTVAGQPLGSSYELSEAVAATPQAQVRGRVDLQRWYGLVARTRQGPRLAQLVRRLGLDRLIGITVQARLVDARSVRIEAQALMPRPWQGLAAAIGDPLAPVWPAAVPDAALWRLTVSVRPRAAFEVLESILAYEHPIELAMARAQLRDLETRMGKGLAKDALGDAARAWSMYLVERPGAKSGGFDTVLAAEVTDGALAGDILGAYAGVLKSLLPQLGIERTEQHGATVVTLALGRGAPPLAVGFRGSEIVVATSSGALRGHLMRRGKPRPIEGVTPGAVAYLAQADGPLAAALLSSPRPAGPWAAVAAALGRGGADARLLEEVLAGSVGAVRAKQDGFVLELVTRGKPPR